MKNTSVEYELSRMERQFHAVSVVLASEDPADIPSSFSRLQQMAVDLKHCVEGPGVKEHLTSETVVRILSLAQSAQVLREGLLRRSAYVDSALQVILPIATKATYADRGPYGKGMRQSGTLKTLAA